MSVYALISGNGGTGRTHAAVRFAEAAARRGKTALVVELCARSVDAHVGQEQPGVYDVTDVISGLCSVKQAISSIDRDIHVLPGWVGEAPECGIGAFQELIGALRDQYDCIFIDAPGGVTPWSRAAMCVSGKCVIVERPGALFKRGVERIADAVKIAGCEHIYCLITQSSILGAWTPPHMIIGVLPSQNSPCDDALSMLCDGEIIPTKKKRSRFLGRR